MNSATGSAWAPPCRSRRHVRTVPLARSICTVAVCFALAGCAGGPSFSELFDTSAAAEGTGIQGVGLVRAVVILARHQATPQQRAVATRNAEAAIARMEREIAAERPKTTAKKKSPPRKKTVAASAPSGGTKPKPEEEPEPEPAPAKPSKKLPAASRSQRSL